MSQATIATASAESPSPTLVLFARGVIARLALWPALRIAIEQGWGGPRSSGLSKRRFLASLIVDAFSPPSSPPDEQYIEEMIMQVLEDEFEMVLEDGSVQSAARDVVRLWGEVSEGRTEGVVALEELEGRVGGGSVSVERAGEESESESESESASESASASDGEGVAPPGPVVDEDGFTLVQSKRRR